jgi:REP element-mobilizing transposase RayT
MLQVNGTADHIHILVGLRPDQSIASLVQDVKSVSTKWINQKGFCKYPFSWQGGYGAFSYSKTDVQKVIRYIQNQEAHHRKETFLDEYRLILKNFEIDYNEDYIFKEPE